MKERRTLEEKFADAALDGRFKATVHPAVIDALNPKFTLRPYQKEALLRFDLYLKHFRQADLPDQLLFHMATGSGKTLIMAALIIDLYRRGYRRFLFLVDSTNIIDKTRDNFLNPASGKYLFQQPILIDLQRVTIRETDNFESIDPLAINIVFTTVQGLHSQLTQPRENMMTAADIGSEPIVMISDEAHHINAATKKGRGRLNRVEEINITSWEQTVDKIFLSQPQNLLLEFTATAPLDHPEVAEKYRDKILMDYPLRRFRQEGFSKEVKVLQSDMPRFERTLQALVLSHYRQKMFAAAGLSVKPVVLFKSRTIAESREFHDEFLRRLPKCARELEVLRAWTNQGRLAEAFAEFDRRGLGSGDLAAELSAAFAPDRLMVVDSKSDGEEKQLAINSLEDSANPYRGIFAVDKLNEGWDVLNLFDIVRLYDVAGSGGKLRKTTMAEAQLIGRGARYFPFRTEQDQVLDRRKFDDFPDHPLRIGEELVYHAAHNPSYIAELGLALTAIGIQAEKGEKRVGEPKSEREKKPKHRPVPQHLEIELFEGRNEWTDIFDDREDITVAETFSHTLTTISLGSAVWKKAFRLRRNYWFDRLQSRFPKLTGMAEFAESKKYLGHLKIELSSDVSFEDMDETMKLKVALKVLDSI